MRGRLWTFVAAAAALSVGMAAPASGMAARAAGPTAAVPAGPIQPIQPGTALNFRLVGHNALFNRGMNAALALYKNFAYVGNRTDASNTCPDGTTGCAHVHPGVLILDAKDPANPTVVGEIGPPYEGNVGITSRELRVWPSQKILMVMNFRCSHVIHACPPGNDTTFPFNINFFSLKDPAHPQFIESYTPTDQAGVRVKPHEMFLWADPSNENRALLYLSTPTLSTSPARPNLMVVDISQVPQGGPVTEVAEGNWNGLYPGTSQANYPFDPTSPNGCGPYDCNLFVHSMSVTADGTEAFLSMEAGQFLILDTSSVAAAPSPPTGVISLNNDLITNPASRPVWLQNPPSPSAVPQNCLKNCPNGHSAILIPGTHFVLTTDEVYGTFTDRVSGARGDGHGSSTSPTRPTLRSWRNTRSLRTRAPSAAAPETTRSPNSSPATRRTIRRPSRTWRSSTGTRAVCRPSISQTRRTRPRRGSSPPRRSPRWPSRIPR